MPVTVLVGCQWGDEGKGKVVDLLSRRMDWVARFSGGHNAGHTVRLGHESFVLHLIPCGILQKRPKCVIGHGVVVDPVHLIQEMDLLSGRGVGLEGRVYISEGAHVVLPLHRWMEELEGQDTRIGTTRRGIGPAYQDKAGRNGIRVHEMMDRNRLRRRLEERVDGLAQRYRAAGKEPQRPLDTVLQEWMGEYEGIALRLRPYVADTIDLLHQAHRRGEQILCEGAQGAGLDLDMGTYPYVTSSNTTAGAAATGLGLAPGMVSKVLGISKAYTTRVGEGPFPTEILGEEGEALRSAGAEFGATTGRPRRVGWCDLVQLRQAVRVNGLHSLILTKLDILSGMETLRLCTQYSTSEGPLDYPPMDTEVLKQCTPRYVEMPGWSKPLRSLRRFLDLPEEARRYVRRIETEVSCRIKTLSVGSSRTAVIPVPAHGGSGP